MAKKSRAERDAARARKEASGQFGSDLAAAAAPAAPPESLNESTIERPDMTYGQIMADSFQCAISSGNLMLSSSNAETVKDFLRELADDELIAIAEPGDGIFDYLQGRVADELPFHLRSTVISEIRIARDSALLHLREHAAPENT